MPLITELNSQRQADVKFKACLVYRASSRTNSKATQRNPVSINKQTNKQKKTLQLILALADYKRK